ncbi:hypothetical protein BGZ94_007625 [Podila epigama]|nr:hypothetical protein BGZ94_007625 [Podila epigama]
MSFNQKRSSTTTSASFAPNWTPRRNSSYGHITAGTGGLPSAQTASILASKSTTNPPSTTSSNTRRFSISHPLHPQHRNRSFKARLARACPTLVHGTSRRQRSVLILLCAGGVIVLIYFFSILDIEVSSTLVTRSSSSSSSSSKKGHQYLHSDIHLVSEHKPPSTLPVYKNQDGSDMDTKTIFVSRDFGAPACKAAFAPAQQYLPQELKQERELLREETWQNLNKNATYSLSLAWKRSLKVILPNWKNHINSWIGQGVVLGAFKDGDGKDTTENLKVQIRMIRSISSIPIEVWFEYARDVTDDLHEFLATFGAIIRTLEDDTSNSVDAVVEVTDPDAAVILGSINPPIRASDIEDFKAQTSNKAQIQKALTIASLINSGFEEIVYFSPSTLPMQSPRLLFQQPEYTKTGALFWQHPTSPPSHDSPIWPIIQANCVPTSYEQTWSSFALKHKDSWKGLFLAWYWLTGPESDQFEKIIGHQGNDLLRLAWIAVNRPYAIVDRMPSIGLTDLSRAKGDGIGCNLNTHLYPAPHAPVLRDPKKYLYNQKQHLKLLQKNQFGDLQSVMFIDTNPRGLVHAGSNDRHLHRALDKELASFKDMTQIVQTDSYAAGSQDRVCLQLHKSRKGYRSNVGV